MRKGFTLVELLVIVAILMVLAGLLIPAIKAAMDAAEEASNPTPPLPTRLEIISDPLEIGRCSKLYVVRDKETEVEFVYATDNYEFGSLMSLRGDQ